MLYQLKNLIKKPLKKIGIRRIDQRKKASKRFICGKGIEIGALHNPLYIRNDTKVRYVDYLNLETLRKNYPELAGHELTNIDIIDNGEILSTIPDNSEDFIIANHMLEHCEDPIRTIENHLQKTTTKRCVFYTVPDKRFTFDHKRKLTTFEHLLEDYQKGSEHSRLDHYHEWATQVSNCVNTDEIEAEIKRLMDAKYSIHFHCWDKKALVDFFTQTRELLKRSFTIKLIKQNVGEIIVVLRKEARV